MPQGPLACDLYEDDEEDKDANMDASVNESSPLPPSTPLQGPGASRAGTTMVRHGVTRLCLLSERPDMQHNPCFKLPTELLRVALEAALPLPLAKLKKEVKKNGSGKTCAQAEESAARIKGAMAIESILDDSIYWLGYKDWSKQPHPLGVSMHGPRRSD